MAVAIALINAATADITTGGERGRYVSALMGILYLSGILGPVVGGYVIATFGMKWCFVTATGISVLACLVLLFGFEETLSEESMRAARAQPLSLYSVTIGAAAFLFQRTHTAYIGLIYLVEYLVLGGTFSLLILFVKKNGFDATDVGHIVSLNYIGKSLGVIVLLPLFLFYYNKPVKGPLLAMQSGFVVAVVCYPFYAWYAGSNSALFAITVVEGLDTVWEASLHTMTSVLMTSAEQGIAFGGLSFLRSVDNLLAPVIVNSAWGSSVATDPSIAFYMMSGLSVVALLLSARLRCLLNALPAPEGTMQEPLCEVGSYDEDED